MALPNITKLSLTELRELRVRLDRAVKEAEDRERVEVKREIEELVRKRGLQIADVIGGRSLRGRTVPAKYVHPNDPTSTWSGRGRKPRWLVEALKKGAKQEDFAI